MTKRSDTERRLRELERRLAPSDEERRAVTLEAFAAVIRERSEPFSVEETRAIEATCKLVEQGRGGGLARFVAEQVKAQQTKTQGAT